jgi:hypothetical protein
LEIFGPRIRQWKWNKEGGVGKVGKTQNIFRSSFTSNSILFSYFPRQNTSVCQVSRKNSSILGVHSIFQKIKNSGKSEK